MENRNTRAAERPGKSGKRSLLILGVLTGLVIVLVANAHLVYVAMTSDPECVVTNTDIEMAGKFYRPVKSGC